jgi:hypothetical protein
MYTFCGILHLNNPIMAEYCILDGSILAKYCINKERRYLCDAK